MFADYHVHTEFSNDSSYPMEQVVIDAIAKGVDEICFTDHVDYGAKHDKDELAEIIKNSNGLSEAEIKFISNVDYPRYVYKIFDLQKKYQDQIRIKLGLEFGMQRHTIPKYEKLFSQYDFDFIILSMHSVDNKGLWNGAFWEGKTRDEVYSRYYEEMLYLVTHYKNYSVIGHMDYISRYDPQGEYDFERIRPVIREILKTVIADGKGIEINTSSLRYGMESTPCIEILELYHELGGTIITVGSDSHKPEHLSTGIRDAHKLMKKLGFNKYCIYDRMIPEFVEI